MRGFGLYRTQDHLSLLLCFNVYIRMRNRQQVRYRKRIPYVGHAESFSPDFYDQSRLSLVYSLAYEASPMTADLAGGTDLASLGWRVGSKQAYLRHASYPLLARGLSIPFQGCRSLAHNGRLAFRRHLGRLQRSATPKRTRW